MSPVYQEYYLYAGSLTVHTEPTMVTTVLGSCVSICLWDAVSGIGGMNHYQLPLWNGNGLASPKYGNVAIARLIEKMIAQGAIQSQLRAKVFGGASLIGTTHDSLRVGKRNVEIAWDFLDQFNIPSVASDVGGQVGRKVKFHTCSGTVFVKKINQSVSCKVTAVPA